MYYVCLAGKGCCPVGQVMYFACAKSDAAAFAAVMYSLRESDVALRAVMSASPNDVRFAK